jgi:hypothetical protein
MQEAERGRRGGKVYEAGGMEDRDGQPGRCEARGRRPEAGGKEVGCRETAMVNLAVLLPLALRARGFIRGIPLLVDVLESEETYWVSLIFP